MLGGKSRKVLAEEIRVSASAQRELRGRVVSLERDNQKLWHEIFQMRKELDARLIVKNPIEQQVPVDKYAKMRTSDGLLSYQTYKSRKAGLGGS